MTHKQFKRNMPASDAPNFISPNKFGCLINDDQMDSQNTISLPSTSNMTNTVNLTKGKKPNRLPPIVLHNKPTSHKELVKSLSEICKTEFHIKYVDMETKIFTSNKEEWLALKQNLNAENISYHTYTLAEDKPMEAVLKGLPEGYEEDIYQYFNENQMGIREVLPMKGPNVKQPMYKCNFNKNISFRDITKQSYILSCRVYWTKYRNKKDATQCFRCQRMGHAAKNCNSAPRCVKCGENHLTTTCVKTNETPAKCANCNGNHPANYASCPARAKYRELLERRKSATKINYMPAPIPKQNAWLNHNLPYEKDNFLNDTNFPKLPGVMRNKEKPAQSSANMINILFQEVNELYNICDIDRLINVVKQLKAKLRDCSDDLSRIQAIREISLQNPCQG